MTLVPDASTGGSHGCSPACSSSLAASDDGPTPISPPDASTRDRHRPAGLRDTTSVTLAWTAPGNDGITGTPTYRLRYAADSSSRSDKSLLAMVPKGADARRSR